MGCFYWLYNIWILVCFPMVLGMGAILFNFMFGCGSWMSIVQKKTWKIYKNLKIIISLINFYVNIFAYFLYALFEWNKNFYKFKKIYSNFYKNAKTPESIGLIQKFCDLFQRKIEF